MTTTGSGGSCGRCSRRSPYRVLENGIPADRVRRVRREPADDRPLVTDLKMPGMSGQEVAATSGRRGRISASSSSPGYTDHTYADTLNGPRSRFLEKPFASDVLLQQVVELLAATRA